MTQVPVITALTLCGMPQFIQSEIGTRALRSAYEATALPFGVMDVENAYIPESSLSEFIASAARSSGDGNFGLRLMPGLSVSSYGTWGKYVLQAATLKDSLARFEQVIGLHASYRTWKVSSEGDLIWIRYRFQVKRDEAYANLAFCGVGVLANIVRHYLGPDWKPYSVEIDIPRPKATEELDDAFGCPVYFDQDGIGVAFHRKHFSFSALAKEKEPIVLLSDVKRSRLVHAPNSLSEVVAELIRLQLRKGKVSMERAARSLDMGPRKLRREMDREGTTFRECTKRVRTITAKELLVETDLAFSTISTDLGYANPALFTRAFARDVGQTPSNFRATGTRKHKLGRPEKSAGQ